MKTLQALRQNTSVYIHINKNIIYYLNQHARMLIQTDVDSNARVVFIRTIRRSVSHASIFLDTCSAKTILRAAPIERGTTSVTGVRSSISSSIRGIERVNNIVTQIFK